MYGGFIDLWNGREDREKGTWTDDDGKLRPIVGGRHDRLFSSYILGNRLGDDPFCNSLVDSYFMLDAEVRKAPTTTHINKAFKALPETSKPRLLMVHEILYDIHTQTTLKAIPVYNPEVWKAMAVASVRQDYKVAYVDKKPKVRGRLFYHAHAEGERCVA